MLALEKNGTEGACMRQSHRAYRCDAPASRCQQRGYCSDDCTIQVPVPPARAECWRVCKTRAQPPRPPVRREARADVRSFSNLGFLSRSDMYESGYVERDVDMVFEEPEAEPCLPSRCSPNRAARPALGNKRLPPWRTVAQALMFPHALPVVHGTVEEAEAGLPTRAAATPSQAAIAPTAPKPSIDTAQFRARVAVTPALQKILIG
jgi:hypothetical protein